MWVGICEWLACCVMVVNRCYQCMCVANGCLFYVFTFVASFGVKFLFCVNVQPRDLQPFR